MTSANFPWSAEYGNLELGVSVNSAVSIERELQGVERAPCELVEGVPGVRDASWR